MGNKRQGEELAFLRICPLSPSPILLYDCDKLTGCSSTSGWFERCSTAFTTYEPRLVR